MGYKIKKFIMSNGGRECLILDKETKLPVIYQNLFLITNIRNKSATASTMEIVATNLLIFSNFLKSREIDIIERIKIRTYLSIAEIDDLVRYAKQRFDKQKITNIKRMNSSPLAKKTFSYRIYVFSNYLKWLCGLVHSRMGINANNEVDDFIESIRAHTPKKRSLNMNDRYDKSLSDEEIKILFSLLEIGGVKILFKRKFR